MNHLESSFPGKNSIWRYLIMIVATFAATNTIGAIPLLISIGIKTAGDPSIRDKFIQDPNDLSVLGLNPNIYLLEMLFPFLIGLAVFIFLFRIIHDKSWTLVINGRGTFRWNRMMLSALIWLIFASIYLLVSIKIDPDNYSLNNKSSTLIPLIIISILLIPFQAAWEELFFRGYLMQGFAVLSRNRWMPVLATSFLFALIHIINPEVKQYGIMNMMPQYLLFGLIFGIITVLDDGIEAAIGAHAANNAFLAVMLTNKGSVLQTPAVFRQHEYFPMTEFILMVIIGAAVLIVMKYAFKWKNISLIAGKVVPLSTDGQIP